MSDDDKKRLDRLEHEVERLENEIQRAAMAESKARWAAALRAPIPTRAESLRDTEERLARIRGCDRGRYW